MFADDFLTVSLAEVLRLVVTIVGIWIVVKQLNETRLASQMEGRGKKKYIDHKHRTLIAALRKR